MKKGTLAGKRLVLLLLLLLLWTMIHECVYPHPELQNHALITEANLHALLLEAWDCAT